MYESRHKKLAPLSVFLKRLMRSMAFGLIAIAIGQFIGMWGYHHFEKMNWVDAFVNAAMILSGMGPLGPLNTTAGKIFAGCYALFSGLAFILIMGIIFGPIIHRIFHKFHMEAKSDEK